MAVEACAPGSDNLLLELANDINMAIEASVPVRDILLTGLLNKVKAAIGENASERNTLLRNLAKNIETAIEPGNLLRNLVNNIETAIEPGAAASGNPPTNQEKMKSLDESYCDDTGETMDLSLAGTFSLHRVFSCHLTTSNPQVASVV